ncbi:MAG TPA: N-acetylglucosamine-6-phosphate deacetylase, partial [Chloroflexota bacterium]|nr:N-acetylglucosamine-6-phosphate deacetylase [Chloroflexota bacterium]
MKEQSLALRGRLYRTGDLVRVGIADGAVASVDPGNGGAEATIGGADCWLAPGLVDVQVNGYAGHDVNRPDVTPETISALTRALWRTGVTRFCPTVTTGSFERMARSCAAIVAACEEDPSVDRAVLAIHVEGPYFAPEDGPRGAHPLAHVRPPSYD